MQTHRALALVACGTLARPLPGQERSPGALGLAHALRSTSFPCWTASTCAFLLKDSPGARVPKGLHSALPYCTLV